MAFVLEPTPQIHPVVITATGFTWGPLTLDRISETADQLVLQAETERALLVIHVDNQGYPIQVRVMNKGPAGLLRTDEPPLTLTPKREPDADARLVVRTTVKGVGWGGATVNMGYFDQKFFVQEPGGRWLFARHATLGEYAGVEDGTLLARN